MHKYQRLPAIVGEIYDAALQPRAWTDVLAKIAEFAGGRACGLVSRKSLAKPFGSFYCFGIETHFLETYSKTYWEYDPIETLFERETEEVVSLADLVTEEEFREGRFYQEWVRPQGLIDAAKVVLEKSDTNYAYLSVMRSKAQGMVDEEMRAKIALLVPHVRRSLLIGKIIDVKQKEARTFASTLDELSAAVFLLDASGLIIHSNHAGNDIIGGDDFLRAVGGRLIARDPKIDFELRRLFPENSYADRRLPIKCNDLPLISRTGERYVAHLLPLTLGARKSAGVAYAAVAAIFVHKAKLKSTSSEIVKSSYRLTTAEVRVLQAIVEIGGTRDVAMSLGLTDNTVKTHLSRLFEKTGTKRQAELVKLVAGFATPLIN